MRLQNEETNHFAWIFLQNVLDRKEVILRFGHLFVMNRNEAVVQPILGKAVFIAQASLRLCNLVFMMREDQVTSATMEIKFLAEIFQRHRGAFNVPARTTFSPGAVPARFAWFGRFPKRKIHRMLFPRIDFNAGTSLHILQFASAELTIAGKFLYTVKNIAVIHSISVTIVDKLLYHRNDIRNGLTDTWIYICALYIERIHCFKIGLDIAAGDITPLQSFFVGRIDDFIIHIRKILDVMDSITLLGKITANDIPSNKGARIADMRMIIRRYTTAVDAHFALFERFELFFPA